MFIQHYARHLTSCLTRQRSNKGWMAAFLPIALAACGGGGGGDYSSPTLTAPTAIPFPPADYSAGISGS